MNPYLLCTLYDQYRYGEMSCHWHTIRVDQKKESECVITWENYKFLYLLSSQGL